MDVDHLVAVQALIFKGPSRTTGLKHRAIWGNGFEIGSVDPSTRVVDDHYLLERGNQFRLQTAASEIRYQMCQQRQVRARRLP